MSLAGDLLEQARHLARCESRRPKQASLRRAVSAAYYSLFHLLVAEASHDVVAGDSNLVPLRPLVGRVYDHGEMKRVCAVFSSGGTLPASVTAYIRTPFSADLRFVADTFPRLQQWRHGADYDTGTHLTRDEALDRIELTERAFAAWNRIRTTGEARVFLLSLLFWKSWTR